MENNISGIIERITHHNAENGFAVLRIQAKGHRHPIKLIGYLAHAAVGEYIEAVGDWDHDRDHGEQFRASEVRSMPPLTLDGIEKYLGSGLVKGIGPHYAKKIVAVFGARTLEVIDESPSYLREIKGIGPRRIQQIRASWQEQKAIRGIMVFLQSHGIGTSRAVRIYKLYGDQALDIVKANPYRLASDVWGMGFKTVDELAGRLGISPQSPQRARAGLLYVLQQLSQEGHVGFAEEAVLQKTAELTGIARDVLVRAVEEGRKEDELVREPAGEEPWLYLKPLFLAELGVARNLTKLQQGDHPLPRINPATALVSVEATMNLQLAPSQREAIEQALKQKVLVITGGPGVGKTTIVRGILEIFSRSGLRCALSAPTGRAAKRLTETTGREARTIHRLLEFDPAFGGFKRDAANPLNEDLIVIDEASMVDIVLMNQLTRAIPPHACLILVGDVDQLPSVGAGRVLADVIESGCVPTVRLTQIFRQAKESWIVRAAHAVNQGDLPESAPPGGQGDFYFVEAATPERLRERLLTLIQERIPNRFGLDPLRDVQILTPMNRSELGAEALNRQMQEVLNPPKGQPQVERFGSIFRVGDKVIQTQNNYTKEVFNGDIGRIRQIEESEREVVIDFDGREVVYDFGELDELSLAYALTIHKSQGSEYPAVVIPLHTQHFLMLQRNLLYTGVTRGKRLVVLLGSRRALELAVGRQDLQARCSGLRWRLKATVRRSRFRLVDN